MSKVSGDLIGALISIVALFVWVALLVLGVVGYVLNLITLYHAAVIGGPITLIIVLRAVGIVVPFVGSVLGFL